MFQRRRRQSETGTEGSEAFAGLRTQVMELDPATVGLDSTPELPNVWGGLMEMGFDEGVATIVALADGTTSMYTTGGGGVIGGGAHPAVVAANRGFLTALEHHLDELQPDPRGDLPPTGAVCFRAMTYAGRRAGTVAQGDERLSQLEAAGQALVTALREVAEVR